MRNYRKKNQGYVKWLMQYSKEWRENNKEYVKQKNKENYLRNKKQRKEYAKEYNKKFIVFQGKKIKCDCNPRQGFCSRCGEHGRTEMHHEKYDFSNPLAHTIELCRICHLIQTIYDKYPQKVNLFNELIQEENGAIKK